MLLQHGLHTVRFARAPLVGLEGDAAEYAAQQIYGGTASCDDEHAAARDEIARVIRSALAVRS